MKKIELEVLSDETNASVVRMPGRKFPGLVVQGDRLNYLNAKASELLEAATASGDARLTRLAGNLKHALAELLDAYSEACQSE